MRSLPRLLVALVCLLTTLGVSATRGAESMPLVMVSSPLLASAVRDLAGDELVVEYLVQPDLALSRIGPDLAQMKRLASASLVLRHEHQAHLDRCIGETGKGLRRLLVLEIIPPTGPAYAAFCAKLSESLVQFFPSLAGSFRYNLTRLRNRLQVMELDLKFRAQAMEGEPVLCQSWCKPLALWLGLEAAAEFSPSVGELDQDQLQTTLSKVKQGSVSAVLARAPEAERFAAALAKALKVRTVLISVMPTDGRAGAMERLIRTNSEQLLAALDS